MKLTSAIKQQFRSFASLVGHRLGSVDPKKGLNLVRNESRGFTLIELLVSIGVSVVAGYLLTAILVQNNGIFLKQNATLSQGMNLNDISFLISDSIKQATTVVASSPTTPSYTSSYNTLVLALPGVDSSGNTIANTSDYLVIAPDNSLPAVLRYQIFPTSPSLRKAANRVLVTNLSSIRFLYLNFIGNQVTPSTATKVNYTINLSEKAGLTAEQASTSGEVSLRNN